MQILQVNTQDQNGGAAQIARQLFQAYEQRGHGSYLAVGFKTGEGARVFEVPNDASRNAWTRPWRILQRSERERGGRFGARAAHWLATAGEPSRWLERRRGLEDFNFPGTSRLFDLLPQPPDIVHLHNLHGDYFDLRVLPEFSRRRPTIITLHDEWIFTGHCAYTLGCERWETGCGECPHLNVYPAIVRDATGDNLRRKGEVYARSRVYAAAPSRWLLDRAMRSVFLPAVAEGRVIPNGIDLTVYRPGDREAARDALGLPRDAAVVLFVANKTRSNSFKDYATMEAAVRQVAADERGREVIFLCLGEEGPDERVGAATIRFMNYQTDPGRVALFYHASDVYLHAARGEAFGLVIAEAMACGVPAIATAVGGIPEIIEDGATGFLVPAGDGAAMAARVRQVLEDATLRRAMSERALESARRRFGLERMVNDYLEWYEEILEREGTAKP